MKSIIYHAHGRNVEIPAEYAHLVCMKRRDDLAKEYEINERDLRTLLRKHAFWQRIRKYKFVIRLRDYINEPHVLLNNPLAQPKLGSVWDQEHSYVVFVFQTFFK